MLSERHQGAGMEGSREQIWSRADSRGAKGAEPLAQSRVRGAVWSMWKCQDGGCHDGEACPRVAGHSGE